MYDHSSWGSKLRRAFHCRHSSVIVCIPRRIYVAPVENSAAMVGFAGWRWQEGVCSWAGLSVSMLYGHRLQLLQWTLRHHRVSIRCLRRCLHRLHDSSLPVTRRSRLYIYHLDITGETLVAVSSTVASSSITYLRSTQKTHDNQSHIYSQVM